MAQRPTPSKPPRSAEITSSERATAAERPDPRASGRCWEGARARVSEMTVWSPLGQWLVRHFGALRRTCVTQGDETVTFETGAGDPQPHPAWSRPPSKRRSVRQTHRAVRPEQALARRRVARRPSPFPTRPPEPAAPASARASAAQLLLDPLVVRRRIHIAHTLRSAGSSTSFFTLLAHTPAMDERSAAPSSRARAGTGTSARGTSPEPLPHSPT